MTCKFIAFDTVSQFRSGRILTLQNGAMMISEDMAKMLRKLTQLAFCFTAVIDARKHDGVRKEHVISHIERGTIFDFLAGFEDIARWGLGSLSEDDKRHLLGEWQSMSNAIDSERKFGVADNGICLLSAYVIEGIQMRTFANKICPGQSRGNRMPPVIRGLTLV